MVACPLVSSCRSKGVEIIPCVIFSAKVPNNLAGNPQQFLAGGRARLLGTLSNSLTLNGNLQDVVCIRHIVWKSSTTLYLQAFGSLSTIRLHPSYQHALSGCSCCLP